MTSALNYTRSTVAFLDILGFSQLVLSSRHPRRAKQVIRILENAMSRFEWGAVAGPDGRYDVRAFSDAVCIVAPNSSVGVNRVLYRVATIQLCLAVAGILTRGGIAFGKHHDSGRLLFSEGLVQAYTLEHKRAIFPRVILSDDVLEFLVRQWVAKPCQSAIRNLLLQDADGEVFVAYLSLLGLEDFPEDRTAVMRRHGTVVRENLDANHDSHVLRKLRWLQRYHNYTARLLKLDSSVNVGRGRSGFSQL